MNRSILESVMLPNNKNKRIYYCIITCPYVVSQCVWGYSVLGAANLAQDCCLTLPKPLDNLQNFTLSLTLGLRGCYTLTLFYLINTPRHLKKTADNVFSAKVLLIVLLNTTALLRDTTESESLKSPIIAQMTWGPGKVLYLHFV